MLDLRRAMPDERRGPCGPLRYNRRAMTKQPVFSRRPLPLPLFRRLCAALALCVLPLTALADEAEVRKLVEAKFKGAKIESVTRSPYSGLYEV
ncbi:MAG: disulfide isomerase DsbC N-terminal domain-containing protein, partial [Myxococcota bacterium]